MKKRNKLNRMTIIWLITLVAMLTFGVVFVSADETDQAAAKKETAAAETPEPSETSDERAEEVGGETPTVVAPPENESDNQGGNDNPYAEEYRPDPNDNQEPGDKPGAGGEEEPKPGDNPEPQPGDNPNPQPGDNPDPQPEPEPDPQPGDNPEPQPGDNPNPQPGDNPDPQPEPEPDPQPGDNPEPQPGDNPEDNPNNGGDTETYSWWDYERNLPKWNAEKYGRWMKEGDWYAYWSWYRLWYGLTLDNWWDVLKQSGGDWIDVDPQDPAEPQEPEKPQEPDKPQDPAEPQNPAEPQKPAEPEPKPEPEKEITVTIDPNGTEGPVLTPDHPCYHGHTYEDVIWEVVVSEEDATPEHPAGEVIETSTHWICTTCGHFVLDPYGMWEEEDETDIGEAIYEEPTIEVPDSEDPVSEEPDAPEKTEIVDEPAEEDEPGDVRGSYTVPQPGNQSSAPRTAVASAQPVVPADYITAVETVAAEEALAIQEVAEAEAEKPAAPKPSTNSDTTVREEAPSPVAVAAIESAKESGGLDLLGRVLVAGALISSLAAGLYITIIKAVK